MPVTTFVGIVELPPTHRCQGCGEYLWPHEVTGHHQVRYERDGEAYPEPCGPVDELPKTRE